MCDGLRICWVKFRHRPADLSSSPCLTLTMLVLIMMSGPGGSSLDLLGLFNTVFEVMA